MRLTAEPVTLEFVRTLRESYRLEMNCQIIHDSIHGRAGWTREYALRSDGSVIGYGSVAVAGPWQGKPAVYEFYIVPAARPRVFEHFSALLSASGALMIDAQSNDPLLAVILPVFCPRATSEAILFRDGMVTMHAPPVDVTFRSATATEAPDADANELVWRGVVEVNGEIAATGGVLFHYNPPFGDVYMKVAAPFRRRGFGAFIVQELKRRCYEAGIIPGARCNLDNTASRRTLQKAGFVPCGHMMVGPVTADVGVDRADARA